MAIVVWIAEGVWEAAVDAARTVASPESEFVLLHVIPVEVEELWRGAIAGLLGRPRPSEDVGAVADAAAEDLLAAAANRLTRPARRVARRGRVEREVVAAAEHADLLVVSRDGDRERLGPRSLGTVTRFVVDHAPCPLLLVWPGTAPELGSIPPSPHHRRGNTPPGPPQRPPPPPARLGPT